MGDGATSNMLTYNCRTEKWRDMGNQCTTCRSYHGMTVIGQRIYVLGGFNGCECHRTVVCFDVVLGRWSYKAHMGRARCYVSVAVLKGYIYAMGGFDGRRRTRTVDRYSVKNDQWTNVANMNYMRSDASAAAAYGRIYIADGFTGRRFLDTVECYDPLTKVWTLVKSMPWLSSGHKLIAHDDMIYYMGGSNNNGGIFFVTQYDEAAPGASCALDGSLARRSRSHGTISMGHGLTYAALLLPASALPRHAPYRARAFPPLLCEIPPYARAPLSLRFILYRHVPRVPRVPNHDPLYVDNCSAGSVPKHVV